MNIRYAKLQVARFRALVGQWAFANERECQGCRRLCDDAELVSQRLDNVSRLTHGF